MKDIDFDKGDGLVPAIVQDAITSKVLMLGYMNAEALEKTKTSGLVTFYSRSKQRLWTKGEESGNHLQLEDILLDCDRDTLLVRVRPVGPVCHQGPDTCWGETNEGVGFLDQLDEVITARRERSDTQGTKPSYVSSLFEKGKVLVWQQKDTHYYCCYC